TSPPFFQALPATQAKVTLTKANGISANRRSDKKIVQTLRRQRAVAIKANKGDRYFLAKVSTPIPYTTNSAAYESRSHGAITAGSIEPNARAYRATIPARSGGHWTPSSEPGSPEMHHPGPG